MSKWTFKPQIHEKLRFLLTENWRFKIVHGGRGGGKSYSFADAALARTISEKINLTVFREFDTTICDSVHKLLSERIDYHNLTTAIKKTDKGYKLNNGSIINYNHLHNNITEVKGAQNINIAWVFEAEKLTKDSWDILYPTVIRNYIGEIWIEFNADNDDDFVMQRFVYKNDPDTKVVQINYTENPLCPKAMVDEAEKCKKEAIDDYNHIWLGMPARVGSKIYPTFDKDVHVRPYNLDMFKETGNFFMGQDPATVYYPFVVWIARVDKGDNDFFYVIYNEFPTVSMMGGKFFHEVRNEKICSLTLKQRANMFRVLDRTVESSHNWLETTARAIDTRFVKASGAASTTLNTRGLIHTMADPDNGGMAFETPPEGMIDVQRDRLRELMDWNKDLGIIPGINEPRIFCMPHVYNVIDAFQNHRVDKTKKCEDAKRKDPIDAIRITMAVMADYPHKRKQKESILTPQKHKADELRDAWMNNR